MQMPLPEILDRYSILLLKVERLSKEFEPELQAYEHAHSEMIFIQSKSPEEHNQKLSQAKEWVRRLYAINAAIWDLEADIRRGKEGELGLEEVGRRAIEIRHLNRQRIAIKNEIVEATGSGYVDRKLDHVSEETR